MATSDSSHEAQDALAYVPSWWFEPVVALTVTIAGLLAMAAASLAVDRVVTALFATGSSAPFPTVTVPGFVLGVVVLAVLYAAVGVGGTYAYLTYRGFDTGFVVERPAGEAARWLAGLLALVPVVVGAGIAANRLLPGGDSGWTVAGTYIAMGPQTLPTPDLPLAVVAVPAILLSAGVVGPAVGTLFHGVFQRSLRQIAPAWAAVAGTAGLVAVARWGAIDAVGAVLLLGFVAAVGYAYERTGNLLVPMAAYAALNAVTLTTAVLFILRAAGRL